MEGERKRKMENEEENEEENMEKFFTLIRSIREVRERMTRGVGKSNEAEQKATETEEKAVQVWMPSFRPEDFMEEAPSKGPETDIAGVSKTHDDKEDGGDGLDLELSL
ncbi:unnamed protein product [Ilex paraguariensis]|uniref:Uncharacterized protein n=1 Tax=Ilex paraguariensis TaxID=185542 RepID=A0ABC8RUL2_9AQUA